MILAWRTNWIVLLAVLPLMADDGWPQWGGVSRDFHVKAGPLAEQWPTTGPRQIWKRELGFGHSSVIVDAGARTLYTMFRREGDEVVVSLDARDGRTIWEYAYPAPFLNGMNMDVGPGPHATPLLSGGRLYTTGVTGALHCLNAESGKVLWRRDLITDLGGTVMARGYSASPIAWRDTVIVPVGGPGHSLVAFDQKTGHVRWSRQDFKNSHSSPILIDLAGERQLVALLDKIIVGINPDDGELLWSHPHDTIGDHTAGTPIWSADQLLFVSSAYDGGSRVLKLTREDGRTVARELWAHKKMRVHHSNVLRIGDYFYGTSGDFGPAFLQATNATTGEVLLRDRAFARANALLVNGNRVLVLDEDGTLAWCSFQPTQIRVHTKAQVLENKAWTPPTLVGSTLYLRDRKHVVALDLR